MVSGTCDGDGFEITSTCCNDDDIKCPGDSCIDNYEKTTTNSIMTTTKLKG